MKQIGYLHRINVRGLDLIYVLVFDACRRWVAAAFAVLLGVALCRAPSCRQ